MAEESEITHSRVLKIAVPIVLSNATVPILGAVDVGVVGQLGEVAPIAAVGLGAIILTTLYWFFGFLRMGTAGLVGQANGAGDKAEVSALLTRSLLIAGAAGIALILLQTLFFRGAFAISRASEEVETLAAAYLTIRIWTAPFAISVYALTGWMVAMERTHGVFWVQLVMNGINILLDFWFVLGLGWGVEGVAFATVMAEITGALLALWFCRDAFENVEWRNWLRVFDRARLNHMMTLNRDILLRSAMLMAIFTSFVLIATYLGDVTVAANEVLIQFLHITAYAMDGFAFAAEAIVASAIGQKNREKLRKAWRYCMLWGTWTCLLLALGFAFGGGFLIDTMAKSVEVQDVARTYLFWMVLAPITGALAWILDGVFIGATRGRDMRDTMVVCLAIYVVAVVALVPLFGNHGLWCALNISLLARGLTLLRRYPDLERSVG